MKRNLEFASHPANLSMVRNFVRQFLALFSFSEIEADLIVLGVDEACTNVIRHAYNHEVSHLMTLTCEASDCEVCFRLRDFAHQKGNLDKLQPRSLDLVQPGGLGIHLMRKAFDQVDYNIKSQGTELVMTKRLDAAAS
jgi:serine/threonine-protein kinase RsbW